MTPERLQELVIIAKAHRAKYEQAQRYMALRAEVAARIARFYREGARPLGKFERWLTGPEVKLLRARGSVSIKMNDLFRVSYAEEAWLKANHPNLLRYVRTKRYPEDQWIEDRPSVEKPAQIRAIWMHARPLDEDIEEQEEAEEQGDADTTEEVERLRPGMVRGENLWTDTEYPVLEADMLFMVRTSRDDLDDLFGEEPKDPRAEDESSLITARRMWRASPQEEAMQESTAFSRRFDAAVLPSGPAVEELFGETPEPGQEGGFFISRAEYFAQRDQNTSALFSPEYERKPMKKAAPARIAWSVVRKAQRKAQA